MVEESYINTNYLKIRELNRGYRESSNAAFFFIFNIIDCSFISVQHYGKSVESYEERRQNS